MRAFKQNPHPVDMNDFFRSQLTIVNADKSKTEAWDEELTDAPVPAPTFKSNLLKLRKSVSEKLFSIELRKISF